MPDNDLTHAIIGAAIEVHRLLGPGLLESAYEECLAREFVVRGIPFERQKPSPVVYKDVKLECGYRMDFLVDGKVVVELKAVEGFAPVHEAIVLTYLKALGLPPRPVDKLQCANTQRWNSAFCAVIGRSKS